MMVNILHKLWLFILSLLFIQSLIQCKPDESKLSIQGNAMGTSYSIVILEKDNDINLSDLLSRELERLETIFSTYKEDSEITAFNKNYSIDKFYPLSREFLEVWNIGREIENESGGAFSPDLGNIVEAWGFGNTSANSPVSMERINTLIHCKNSILWDQVNGGVIPRESESFSEICGQNEFRQELDFSGIVKGYAIDRIMDILRQNGIDTAMVEIGGDLCVKSSIHDPYTWKIGIRDLKRWGVSRSLKLENGCVATSGNAHQRLYREGKDYTHIIDPLTGMAISTELSSVTVVMEKGNRLGARSDAWATALFALGEKEISIKENSGFFDKMGIRVYFSRGK